MKNFFQNQGIGTKLILGFLVIYLLRLLSSQFMGIMPQDAYYFLYSEYPDFSYFDHPPMVAYMLKATHFLFGQHVWVIKATDFLVSLLVFITFYYLSALFLSRRRAIYSAFFYGATLQLTLLSINTTPDVPLLLFWTLALIALYKAVFSGRMSWWVLSGTLIGLAFMSKYTGVLLIGCLGLFLLASKAHRKYLLSPQFFVLLFFAAVFAAPVVWWNVSHDWISFKFQSTERVADTDGFSLKPALFFGNIATQFLLIIPVGFVLLFVAFYKYTKKMVRTWDRPRPTILFLLAFSLPIVLFFYSVGLVYWVKVNWTMPAYLAGFILVAHIANRKMVGYQIGVSLFLHVLLFIQVAFYIVPVNSDDTWYGWESVADQVDQLNKQHPDDFLFSSDFYKTSAVLNYYLDQRVYGSNLIGKSGLQFSIIDSDLRHLYGKNALFIDSQKKLRDEYLPPDFLAEHFEKVEALDPILVKDNSGKVQRIFAVYRCFGYRGPGPF